MPSYPPDTNVFEDYQDNLFGNFVREYDIEFDEEITRDIDDDARRMVDVDGEGVLTHVFAYSTTFVAVDGILYRVWTNDNHGAFPLMLSFDDHCKVFVRDPNGNAFRSSIGIKVK